MANQSIRYSCGHTEGKQLLGKMTDRQAYIDWAAAKGACSACRAADKLAALDDLERANALADLTGSAKQIAWARTIRGERVTKVITFMASMTPQPGKEDAFAATCGAIRAAIASKSDSRFWIDNRDRSAAELCQLVMA